MKRSISSLLSNIVWKIAVTLALLLWISCIPKAEQDLYVIDPAQLLTPADNIFISLHKDSTASIQFSWNNPVRPDLVGGTIYIGNYAYSANNATDMTIIVDDASFADNVPFQWYLEVWNPIFKNQSEKRSLTVDIFQTQTTMTTTLTSTTNTGTTVTTSTLTSTTTTITTSTETTLSTLTTTTMIQYLYVGGVTATGSSANQRNWHIKKYDTLGNELASWNKTIDSTAWDEVNDIEVDAAGNVYVAGFYSSASAGRIKKFTSLGVEITGGWDKSFSPAYLMQIDSDAAGNVYVVYSGTTGNIVVRKFLPDGSEDVSWNKTFTFNPGVIQYMNDIAVTPAGDLYMAGFINTAPDDIIMTKFFAAGTEDTGNWHKLILAAGTWESATNVAVDSNGYIYVGGNLGSGTQYFIKKYDSNGIEQIGGGWPQAGSGSTMDVADIAIDSNDNVIVAIRSSTTWITNKYGPGGGVPTMSVSQNYGGFANGRPKAVAIDALDLIYVVGYDDPSFGQERWRFESIDQTGAYSPVWDAIIYDPAAYNDFATAVAISN